MRRASTRRSLALILGLVLAIVFAALVVPAPGARATHDTVMWTNYGDLPGADHFDRQYSPILGRGGTLYVPYVTYNTLGGVANLNLTKLTTGGGPLNTPVVLLDRQVNDVANVVYRGHAPSIAIDHSGNLYVAWTRVPSGSVSYDVYVSKSLDGGNTWLPAVRANQPNNNELDYFPSVTTTPDGTVWVAYVQTNGPFTNITVSRSTNGGNTFSGWVNASQQRSPTDPIAAASIVSDSLGRLYLLYDTYSFTPFFHYIVNYTWSDDGTTWSTPTPITPPTIWAFYGAITIDSSNRVRVIWADWRNVITFGTATVWYMESTDRGATWSPQAPIEHTPVSSGPYNLGVIAYGENVMAVWGHSGPGLGLTYVVSADGGTTWYDATNIEIGYDVGYPAVAMDENGTFWASVTDFQGAFNRIGYLSWNSPPNPPANVAVARSGPGNLTVSWTLDSEKDVAAYSIWRSSDGGQTYQLVATAGPGTASWQDTSLSNGTYWYRVAALDLDGTSSHESNPMSGTVGPTTEEMIASLETQITALEGQLSNAQANLTAVQNQITILQQRLTALQNSEASSNAATAAALASLQQQINSLQQQLNQTRQDLANARAEQATQTISYVNMGFEILVVVLLAVILLMQVRRPKTPVQVMAPSPPSQVMTQPPAPPRSAEDDL